MLSSLQDLRHQKHWIYISMVMDILVIPTWLLEEARNYEVGFSHNDHTGRHAMNISLFLTNLKYLIDAPWGFKIPAKHS